MLRAPTHTTTHDCACGECGLTFTLQRPLRGQPRRYAPDCPVREAQERESNRLAAKRTHAKRRAMRPRYCICGCGRTLPRYVRLHPDCSGRAPATEEPALIPHPKTARCGLCCGQGWRRDERRGCPRCKKPYEPEPPPRSKSLLSSPLGIIE